MSLVIADRWAAEANGTWEHAADVHPDRLEILRGQDLGGIGLVGKHCPQPAC